MATLVFTGPVNSGRFSTWTWTGLDEADTALTAQVAILDGNYSDISIEFDDTGGAWGGATFVVEGRGVGFVNWAAMSDLGGTALSFTADAAAFVREAPYAIRPRATAGSSTNVTCRITARRINL